MSANINENKAICHVDCDAFFASCEAARDPKLKGLPVATGKERGIVSCPSYEAKAMGVARGMMLGEAKKICPELITLPSDYELYSIYSNRIFTIIRSFTPEVEEYSIDEAFCDLTGLRRIYRMSYPDIAHKIKKTIQDDLNITVSVGLSSTKTLAKLASKENKPDGFMAVRILRLNEFLKNMPLERVCGFGPNTVGLLNKCGIKTVLEYINRPKAFARGLLGKIGEELWMELRGIAVYKIITQRKDKYLTISKTKTFSPPSQKKEFVKAQLMRNLESAMIKLRRHNLSTRNLTVYLKKADFDSCGAEGRLTRHSSSTLDFTKLCGLLFEETFKEGDTYRATGVILADIEGEGIDSRDLFDDPIMVERLRKISAAADKINEQYGKHALHIASSNAVTQKGSHPRNCLASRKTELLKGENFRQRLDIPLLNLKWKQA